MSSNLYFYIICGGFHSPSLTANFFTYLATIINDINEANTLIIPLDHIQPCDGFNIYQYIIENKKPSPDSTPIIFIGFSAGVVGAIIAGNLWQKNGRKVKALFAFDGWGVPLIADFPCYRLSHDYFTHITSNLFGGDKNAFYASPPVPHLELWRSPENVQGWWEIALDIKKRSNLGEFLKHFLEYHLSSIFSELG